MRVAPPPPQTAPRSTPNTRKRLRDLTVSPKLIAIKKPAEERPRNSRKTRRGNELHDHYEGPKEHDQPRGTRNYCPGNQGDLIQGPPSRNEVRSEGQRQAGLYSQGSRRRAGNFSPPHTCYERVKADKFFQNYNINFYINCMPLEAPVTEHLDKVADAAIVARVKELFANGWFGKEIPNTLLY